MDTQLIFSISTVVTFAIAFALVYWFWQQYIIDVTRQQLFELRDYVFDMASDGLLERDSEPYQVVREMLNSSIRSAHKLNLIHVLFMPLVVKNLRKEPILDYAKQVKEKVNRIPDTETKNQVWTVLRQMHLILFWHLIRVSPLLLMASIVWLLLAFSIRTIQGIRDRFGDIMNGVTYTDAIKHCHSPQQ